METAIEVCDVSVSRCLLPSQPWRCRRVPAPLASAPPGLAAGEPELLLRLSPAQPGGAITWPKPGSAWWSDNVAAAGCTELAAPRGRDEAGEVRRVLCLL